VGRQPAVFFSVTDLQRSVLDQLQAIGEKAARTCSGCPGRFCAPDYGAPRTIARPTRMVSHDPIKDYMQRHGCGFAAKPSTRLPLVPRPAHRPRHQTRSADLEQGRSAGGSAWGAGSLERRPDAAGGV